MKKYARKSDVDGKGMNNGYVFNDGDYYCKTEKEAKTYVENLGLSWEKEQLLINTEEEWFYWTEWELEECEYFDKEGSLYRICYNCKKETKVHEDYYFCTECLTHL